MRAHYGSLGTLRLADGVRDIRGTSVRGSDGAKLGNIDDVIFDHDTMEIRFLAVDSGGWLQAGTFLLPADRVSADASHEEGLAIGATPEQAENCPRYQKESLRSEDEWQKYEQEFKKYWDEDPVMHMNRSDRVITPPGEPISAPASSIGEGGAESGDRRINAADLFPERISNVFSDPAPGAGKVTLRLKSVARAEEAATGVTLLKPRWWDSFENYLRLNKGTSLGVQPPPVEGNTGRKHGGNDRRQLALKVQTVDAQRRSTDSDGWRAWPKEIAGISRAHMSPLTSKSHARSKSGGTYFWSLFFCTHSLSGMECW